MNTITIKKISPLLATIAMMFWGVSLSFAKIALEELTITQVLFYRLFIAIIFFSPYLVTKILRSSLPTRRQFILLFLASICGFPISMGLQFLGLSYTTASIASILTGFGGVATMIMSFFLLKHKPRLSSIFISLFSILGLVVTVGYPLDSTRVVGALLIIASTFAIALSIIIKKKLVVHMQSFDVVVWNVLFGFLVIGFYYFFTDTKVDIFTISDRAIFSVAMLSLATIVSNILFIICLRHISATRTSQFFALEPIVGAMMGILYLGETFSLNILIGGFLVVGAIIANSIIDDGY